MKLFGRRPERYILALKDLPLFVKATWKALKVFEHPLAVIWLYVTRRLPRESVVHLRDGKIIHLSSDAADIVTVFLIFAREDYGGIVPDSCVVDIGANIGVYALYAAFSGARCVYAYEPSPASYEVLLKNISVNGMESIIQARHVAVVGQARAPVKFPRHSDVMNAILPDSSDSEDYDLVEAIPFSDIVSSLESIDLVKSDCEGAEYDIFLNCDEEDIRKIVEIRMEYHRGPRDELIGRLTGLGYAIRQFMDEGQGGGYLWLRRSST